MFANFFSKFDFFMSYLNNNFYLIYNEYTNHE